MTLEEMAELRRRNKTEKLEQCCEIVPRVTHYPRTSPVQMDQEELPHIFIAVNDEGEAEYRVITEDGRDVKIEDWDGIEYM